VRIDGRDIVVHPEFRMFLICRRVPEPLLLGSNGLHCFSVVDFAPSKRDTLDSIVDTLASVAQPSARRGLLTAYARAVQERLHVSRADFGLMDLLVPGVPSSDAAPAAATTTATSLPPAAFSMPPMHPTATALGRTPSMPVDGAGGGAAGGGGGGVAAFSTTKWMMNEALVEELETAVWAVRPSNNADYNLHMVRVVCRLMLSVLWMMSVV
jgi:hypothetical protein